MLLLDNEQTELTAIEKGKHAYEHIGSFDHEGGRGKTGGIREYARKHGFERKNVERWIGAYKVAKTGTICPSLENVSYRVLYEISKAPEIAWNPLVKVALDEGWTVNKTKQSVKKVKEINPEKDYGYDLQKIYEKAAKNEARRVESGSMHGSMDSEGRMSSAGLEHIKL